jgi:hypothetical protein
MGTITIIMATGTIIITTAMATIRSIPMDKMGKKCQGRIFVGGYLDFLVKVGDVLPQE